MTRHRQCRQCEWRTSALREVGQGALADKVESGGDVRLRIAIVIEMGNALTNSPMGRRDTDSDANACVHAEVDPLRRAEEFERDDLRNVAHDLSRLARGNRAHGYV